MPKEIGDFAPIEEYTRTYLCRVIRDHRLQIIMLQVIDPDETVELSENAGANEFTTIRVRTDLNDSPPQDYLGADRD